MTPATRRASTPATRTFQILTCAAAGMCFLLALLPSAGHDQLWLLLVAARTGPHLDPYLHFFEANPPLPAWLSSLVLASANLLHLPAPVALKSAVLLLAASVFLTSRALLRRALPTLTSANLWFLAFTFVLTFGALPARDFAQRDHVLVLLVLPYLLVAALAAPALALRIPVTLLAALGLALKPHQMLIAVAVETTLLLSRRRPRLLEPALFLLAAAAYFAAIRLVTPEFLTQVLPVLRDTYWANGALTFPQLLGESIQLHLLAATTFSLYFVTPDKPRLLTILLAAASASTLAFYLQDTGWYYHQLPALTLFSFALALLLIQRIHLRAPRWLPAAAAIITVFTLALTSHFMDFHANPLRPRPRNPILAFAELDQPQPTPDPAFFAHLPPGAPVLTLTPTVDDAIMPVILYRLTLAQRYPQFWMLPALLRNQLGDVPAKHRLTSTRLAALTHLQQQFLLEDLQRWHPALILVERCQDPRVDCQAIAPRHPDLLAFFLADPAFREAFTHYHLTDSHGPYDAYTPN